MPFITPDGYALLPLNVDVNGKLDGPKGNEFINELLIPTSLIEPNPQSKLLIVHIPLPGVGEGVIVGVGVGVSVIPGVDGHPVAPKLVKVYNGPPGNVPVEPITITVFVKIFTAVHLSFIENEPAV